MKAVKDKGRVSQTKLASKFGFDLSDVKKCITTRERKHEPESGLQRRKRDRKGAAGD